MNLFSAKDALVFYSQNVDFYIKVGELLRAKIKDSNFNFHCAVCEKITRALPSEDWNLRNQIICSSCRHGGRSRHAFDVINKLLLNNKCPNRLIFEEITDFKKMLNEKIGGFHGVEFLGVDKIPGNVYESNGSNLEHQDICNLSFEDNSFDLICAFDVLEHVYDMEKALDELHRVIDDKGFIVLTVPFYDNLEKTVIRSKLVDGNIINIEPEAYHGNPLSEKGSLVFADPGRDLLDMMKKAGFEIKISLGANIERGLFPDGNSNTVNHCWNAVFVLSKFSPYSETLTFRGIRADEK